MTYGGCKVINPGRTLFITAEDSRDLFTARLREILKAMKPDPEERRIALNGIDVWDVSGEMTRLAQLDKNGGIHLYDLLIPLLPPIKARDSLRLCSIQ